MEQPGARGTERRFSRHRAAWEPPSAAECCELPPPPPPPPAPPRANPGGTAPGRPQSEGSLPREEGISTRGTLVRGNCHLLAFSKLSRDATAADEADPRFAKLLPRRFPRSCSEVQCPRPVQQAGRLGNCPADAPSQGCWGLASSEFGNALHRSPRVRGTRPGPLLARSDRDSAQEGPGGSPARLFGREKTKLINGSAPSLAPIHPRTPSPHLLTRPTPNRTLRRQNLKAGACPRCSQPPFGEAGERLGAGGPAVVEGGTRGGDSLLQAVFTGRSLARRAGSGAVLVDSEAAGFAAVRPRGAAGAAPRALLLPYRRCLWPPTGQGLVRAVVNGREALPQPRCGSRVGLGAVGTPGHLERAVSMEDDVSYNEEEEQKSPLPFLEDEKREGKAGQFCSVEEHWAEYKLEEESSAGGKMGDKYTCEGAEDESDSCMGSLEHDLGDIHDVQPVKSIDRISILALQRKLKELRDLTKEKELAVHKTRDKLSTCQLQLRMLAMQLDYLDTEMEKEEEAGNVAALSYLQAVHRRVCTELEKEKALEMKITLTLKENTLEIWQIETELGKYEILHDQLKKDEEELEMQYQERAEVRIWKEKIAALQAERNRWSREKKEEEAQKESEERHKKILEDAKRNHSKAVCFLRKSLARIRERNAKEAARAQEQMERQSRAVLSLHASLTSSREKLQAIQFRKRAVALEAKKQEVKMREAILAEGGNVVKEMFLHKRRLELEKEKQASRELQKSRKLAIVSQILQEKAALDKQKKSQACTKAVKGGGQLEDSSLWRRKRQRSAEKACRHSAVAMAQSQEPPSACPLADERTASAGEISEPHGVLCESGEDEERNETLLEPEFPGLWGQNCHFQKIPKEEMHPKQLATGMVRKAVSEENMEDFQTGTKQMMSGRECRERAFYSKPSCIHFKDFDVGQTYRKKIALINASYHMNSCRVVGVSEQLKDFIRIHFDPPGRISAGMSCEVVVTFKPMANETLEGEVMFVAQTGPFSVPLKCTAKRCLLALDKELIDFGSHEVGERILQTIKLTNSGALGTRFRVQVAAGDSSTCRATVKSSPGAMVPPHVSDCVSENKVSSTPKTPVAEKEQMSPDHSDVTCCVAQMEQQTGASLSSTSAEQLSQDLLHSRSAVDTECAQNLVALSPEETPVEIMLGKVTEGEIGAFSSVKLPIVFVPALPGDVRADFVIIFDNSDCKPLYFSAVGVSLDMPVWVPSPSVDLKICRYDQLYEESVVIRSRAKATLHLKFELCKELKKHMELYPKRGYIQAQSSFSLQLKFLPRHSLPEDAGNYFNEDTRVLEVPVTILLMDKAKKLNFTVHAIVTSSDLEISPAQINFGCCTIYEAVQANIKLTNKSLLPQEFGFMGLPEFVEVQPNDGFGVVLPLESLVLDIIFKADKAKKYSFELTCRSEFNRQFKLSCRAVGVHPPLELSHSLVQFAATALNDVSTATLYVINSHQSGKHLTHAVPGTGSGEAAPAGPASFEFCMPEDCPVTITPSVGTVLPGKKSLIQVSFRPTLSDQLIREEAVRRRHEAAATGAEIQEKKEGGKREGKKLSVFISRQQSSQQLLEARSSNHLASLHSSEQLKSQELTPDSDAYMAAQALLMRDFCGRFEKYIIPCFVASGCIDEKRGSEKLQCSPHNTLYLELHCPAVAPSLVVTSENRKNTIDFGDVAVGQVMMKQIPIANISLEKLELRFSVLNPSGPFLLVRPVGMLEPGENKSLVISFCPDENKRCFDTLDIQTAKNNLTLRITGHGVLPSTVCSVEGVLNLGYVLAGQKVTSTFKVQNTSMMTLQYSMQLDSLSPTRDRDQQKLPAFLTSSLQRTESVGTQNYNGLSVFSIFPAEGELAARQSQDFVVTFSPDHESLYYSDLLKVVLFGKKVAHEIQLKGAARDHLMFVEGGVPLDVPVESLAVTFPASLQEAPKEELQKPVKSILLILEYTEGESSPVPAVTELKVGAIQTASKKNVEFSLDNLPLLQQKGFAVDAARGTVEAGRVKRVGVSWLPPADFSADDPLLVPALLTVKGDIKESYQILFMAKVVPAHAPAT
ncbi:cilia- and flagella-associated protein 74 [Indicator indicator]|uniref:cilia- and flagella-associated protein 74 n=1 Tax=Indicator indicator TaxID=1002788 RepID=UPI0023DEDAE6|nr:cilia- and flagella-associated protein 74 [Indicator indicator]